MSVDTTETTAVATIDDAAPVDQVVALVKSFGNGNANFNTSIDGGTIESRMALFGALSDPIKVDDYVGKEIKLVDWVVQAVEMPSMESGELVGVPRVTLIDKDGTAYVGTSKPLADATNLLLMLAGPGWNEGGKHLSVMVTRVKTNTAGRTMFKLSPFKSAK